MRKLSCLLLVTLLAACGMKGELYEPPPPPADEATEPETGPDQAGRKTIPRAPDPALSR